MERRGLETIEDRDQLMKMITKQIQEKSAGIFHKNHVSQTPAKAPSAAGSHSDKVSVVNREWLEVSVIRLVL